MDSTTLAIALALMKGNIRSAAEDVAGDIVADVDELASVVATETTQALIEQETSNIADMLAGIYEQNDAMHGYSLSTGANDAVVLTYTDPDTQDEYSTTIATDTTMLEIAEALEESAAIWKEAAENA